MHNQPIPAPHHRIPLGSYTDAAEDRISERAVEAIDANHYARDALMAAWEKISLLREDFPLMVEGYDWADITKTLVEMMPRPDDSRQQMAVFDWAREQECDL